MHKYRPRLHVIRTSDPTELLWSPSQSFFFPDTEFVAVTAYQVSFSLWPWCLFYCFAFGSVPLSSTSSASLASASSSHYSWLINFMCECLFQICSGSLARRQQCRPENGRCTSIETDSRGATVSFDTCCWWRLLFRKYPLLYLCVSVAGISKVFRHTTTSPWHWSNDNPVANLHVQICWNIYWKSIQADNSFLLQLLG